MDDPVFRKEMVTRGVQSDEELRLANDLIAKVHSPDYFSIMDWIESSGATYPGYLREHTRIALWKGEITGALRVSTETIRIGEARLKMGGFGYVTTSPRHRQKGVSRALMEDSLNYMRDHNYHVSMLFGIPNFYHRFGFVTTLADYSIAVEVSEALTCLPAALRTRQAKPGDISAIQKIHVANDTDVACSLLRSSAHLTNKWKFIKGLHVLTNEKGKVLAYFAAIKEKECVKVTEVGLAERVDCRELLAACARFASDAGVMRLIFLVPPPHPFSRFLLRYHSIHEMQVVRNCGGMMTFINLPETLESMIPEWESLLARSALRDARVETTLVVGRTYYRIRGNRGAIDVAQTTGANKLGLSSSDVMHLVTGYAYLEDILSSQRRMLTAEARAFLDVIFPKRSPYVWTIDRF